MHRRTSLIATGLALSLVVAACAGAEDPDAPVDEQPEAAPGEEVPGEEPAAEPTAEEIVLAVSSEPPTLSPHRVGHNEVNSVAMRNVYEALVDRDPETGELIPLLATSWEELAEDHWRFHLREGVTFHDGEPFNADAAINAFEFIVHPDTIEGVGRQYVGPDMSFEAVDDYTLDVLTDGPDPIVPLRMFFLHIFSPDAGGDNPEEELAEHAVGTGPYTLVEWVRGQHLTLEANPDWWGHDDPDGNGEVIYSQARFEFRAEGSVRASMVEAGEADFAMWLGPDECSRLDDRGETRCSVSAAPNTIFMRFDALNEESMLTDPRIREAITLAVDMDLLIEQILDGEPVRASQIVTPGVLGYADDLEPYGYDPDRARELLAEYEADGNQIADVTWAFQEDRFPRVREFVQAAAAMIEDIGISVEILEQETAVLLEEFHPPNQPSNRIKLHTHGNPLGDLGASLGTYFVEPGEPGNPGCWCDDPELFAMIDEAGVLSGEERSAAMEEISRHIHEQRYMDFGGHTSHAYGLSDQLDWDPPLDHFFRLKHMAPR